MYSKSATFYDTIYQFKNYVAEAERIREMVESRMPSARTLLDVACGTGRHIELLGDRFECAGLDLEPQFVEIASSRKPALGVFQGDFTDFDLGRRFDVVTCLFSAIGYAVGKLDATIANLARHVEPGGLLLVEPWFRPGQFIEGMVSLQTAEGPDCKIARMTKARVDGRLSIMPMHHLVGDESGVHHFVEEHVMELWTDDEYARAFTLAGLTPEYDERGLMGRGLWIGRAR